MSDIKITATSPEEFTKISELLDTLPESIKCQIESAKRGLVGTECIIKNNYRGDKQRIFLPSYTTQISDFDDYIGIYADKFFFKLTGELYKRKHDFIILKEDKHED